MIKADTFLLLESMLSSRMQDALSSLIEDSVTRIDDAIEAGDFSTARVLVGKLSLWDLMEGNSGFVEFVTHLAMMFGASRVTQQPGTSVVGMGFESMTVHQLSDFFQQTVTQRCGEFLKTSALAFLDRKEAEVTKAERVLRPFASFVDGAGKAFMNMVSSLHTSRVSAYGFTAEAMALGVTEYQINEQLDNRICPVCRLMHGKKFRVGDARKLLDVVTRTSDPEALKQLQPWPSQTKDSLEAMGKMSSAELVAAGWHIPPFHPMCRGLLAQVGKAPTLDQLTTGSYEEEYKATPEDFEALGLKVTAAQVSKWNDVVGLAPGEVVARLEGVPLDDFFSGLIASEDPQDYSGVDSLLFGRSIVLNLDSKAYGSSMPVPQSVAIDGKKRDLTLRKFEVDATEDELALVRGYMAGLYAVAKDINMKTITITAGGDVGGYAWAKYGFAPDKESWKALKQDISTKVESLQLTALQAKALDLILKSDDPSFIFLLSDLKIGKSILSGLVWQGSLDLSSQEAVIRFLSYIGGKSD